MAIKGETNTNQSMEKGANEDAKEVLGSFQHVGEEAPMTWKTWVVIFGQSFLDEHCQPC